MPNSPEVLGTCDSVRQELHTHTTECRNWTPKPVPTATGEGCAARGHVWNNYNPELKTVCINCGASPAPPVAERFYNTEILYSSESETAAAVRLLMLAQDYITDAELAEDVRQYLDFVAPPAIPGSRIAPLGTGINQTAEPPIETGEPVTVWEPEPNSKGMMRKASPDAAHHYRHYVKFADYFSALSQLRTAQKEIARLNRRVEQRDRQIGAYNSGGFADADALAEKYLDLKESTESAEQKMQQAVEILNGLGSLRTVEVIRAIALLSVTRKETGK